MTYEEKLQEARKIIEEHNQQQLQAADQPLEGDAFFTKLRKEGGTSDEQLASCSWEDLEEFGLPRLLARRVAQVFRTTEKTTDERPKRAISEHRASVMSLKELLQHYDPMDPTTPVAKRIDTIAQGNPCIMFTKANTVDVETSTLVLDELKLGFSPREFRTVGGVPTKIFKIGDRPGRIADENPLYPGRMLRPGEFCDQTSRSWAGVPNSVRYIVYLAITQTHELNVSSLDVAHNVMDIAVAQDAETRVGSRYPKAFILFTEKQVDGTLPSLKVPIQQDATKNGREVNDPFFGHVRY